MTVVVPVVGFIVSLVISTIIIFGIARFFGEKEGISTALLASLIGSIIYALAYYLLGGGLLSALLGGIAWLAALRYLYTMSWEKSIIIAVAVWIVASVVSLALPTLVGPLFGPV